MNLKPIRQQVLDELQESLKRVMVGDVVVPYEDAVHTANKAAEAAGKLAAQAYFSFREDVALVAQLAATVMSNPALQNFTCRDAVDVALHLVKTTEAALQGLDDTEGDDNEDAE